MALPTTASLPPLPSGLGLDDTGRTEYFDALNKVLKSLETRGSEGPNLWNAAAAFLNPGRTGQFGEALGNVASSVGKDVEKQQEYALPIAQMRATIAGQKYQVQNESKALGILANALDTTPQKAGDMVVSGDMTPDMLTKIPSGMYVMINKLDPKLGEGLKNAFNMDVERRKLVNEDVKNHFTYADLVAKYGKGVDQYLTPGFQGQGQNVPSVTTNGQDNAKTVSTVSENTPTANTVDKPKNFFSPKELASQIETDFGIKLGPAALERTPQQQQDLIDRAAKGEKGIFKPAPIIEGKKVYHEGAIDVPQSVPESYLNSRGYYRPDKGDPVHAIPMPNNNNAKPITTATSNPTTNAAQLPDDLLTADEKNLPLAVQAQIKQKRVEANDEMYKTHRADIIAYTPQQTDATARRLRELHDIADSKYGAKIFGLMQKQGTISAIQNAAQEGITAGRLGSISTPVQTFLEKQKLSPEQQRVLRRTSQLLAEQFFENGKAEKSVLGPQISNADAQFMQRPMVSEKDANSTVRYWTEQQLLLNHQRGELFKSLQGFDKKYGSNVPSSRYFGSDDYTSILKKYDTYNNQLRQRYPDFGAQ